MIITSILLLLALVSAIIGTYWESTYRGKMLLVLVAVLSCSGAMYQAHKTNKENEFNKRVLEHLIRATEPPEFFTKFLRQGIRDFAKENGYWMHQQEDTKKDIAIFFLAPANKNPGENDIIILLRESTMERIFLSYVSGTPISVAIKNAIKIQWGGGNLTENWNDFVGTLTDLVTLAATYHEYWKEKKFKVNSIYMRNDNYVKIAVCELNKNICSEVEFNKKNIESILRENLISRDQHVFNYAILGLSKREGD